MAQQRTELALTYKPGRQVQHGAARRRQAAHHHVEGAAGVLRWCRHPIAQSARQHAPPGRRPASRRVRCHLPRHRPARPRPLGRAARTPVIIRPASTQSAVIVSCSGQGARRNSLLQRAYRTARRPLLKG